MDTLILVIAVIIVMVLGMKLLDLQPKPGKKCQSCPEFKNCGGGRPRCPRRGGSV